VTGALPSASRGELGTPPYLGLRPFEASDAAFFFGRRREIDLLTANLRTARTSLVYGESGVGKSSLIRAGLGPELQRRSARSQSKDHEGESVAAVIVAMTGEDPTPAVASAILSAIGVPAGIDNETSLLVAVERAIHHVGRLLIVLDQFEEYLATPRTPEEAFGDDLVRVVTRSELPVQFMIVIREDAISKLDRFRSRSHEFTANPIRIAPLAFDAAEEAVTGPLRVYNELHHTAWDVEQGFADVVIDATRVDKIDLGFGGRGGLEQVSDSESGIVEVAYLQIVLRRVWDVECASNSSVMRVETFRELGGVAGIVRAHLDEIMGHFSREDQAVAAAAFRYLVTPSGMKVPYSPWDLSEMTHRDAERVGAVLERLAQQDMRVVRPLAPSPRGDLRYEIYHDRLADPILDWRIRRERGGDRAAAVRLTSLFTAAVAAIGAIVSVAAGTNRILTVSLLAAAAVYTVFWRLPGVIDVFDAYESLVRRLLRPFGQRKREPGP
jgi:hypothetical protein